MAKKDLEEIDFSSIPSFDEVPLDLYHDVVPDPEEFDAPDFDMPPGEVDHTDYEKLVAESLKDHSPKPEKVVRISPKPKKRMEQLPEIDVIDQFINLPDSIRDTVVGKYAVEVARSIEFPEASTLIALLGCASASVATNYAVQYRTGSSLSTGLYVVVEQPPSTQKTRILGAGLKTYKEAMKRHNAKVFAKLREAKEGDPDLYHWLRPGFVYTTDATTASIDKNLASSSEGRFVIASAEQSALISMFPAASSFASTNELILKGYAGEDVSGMRSGRQAFNGIANGTVVLIAQSGSAHRILSESNGTGMAERFFFVAEPDYLGYRKFKDEPVCHEIKKAYDTSSLACVQSYSGKIHSHSNADENRRIILDPENLDQLRATQSGYEAIREYRVAMEPRLKQLKDSGDMVMLSWLGKFEAHVLKIAAVLHVFECLGNESKVPEVIPDKMLFAAIDLVEVMSEHQEKLIQDSGESGMDAEEQAVIEVISGSSMTKSVLLQKLRFRKPFRAMNKLAYKAAGKRVEMMVNDGKLIINSSGKLEVV